MGTTRIHLEANREASMQIQGAVIKEQGVTFAVVVVKPHVVQNAEEARGTIADFTPVFRVPVVLMAPDPRGRPTYFGRPDIARFMANVPVRAIPWRTYTIN
jgi:hypothetical protein